MDLWKYRYERHYVNNKKKLYFLNFLTLFLYLKRMDDMEQTDFFGVSGAVKFDKLGNRMSKVVVEQLRSKF